MNTVDILEKMSWVIAMFLGFILIVVFATINTTCKVIIKPTYSKLLNKYITSLD